MPKKQGFFSAMCVQRVDDSLNSAIHTTFSHFAAFFIVARTKRSIVERCILFDAFALVTLVSKSTVWCENERKKKRKQRSGASAEQTATPKTKLKANKRIRNAV